ncbi:MAG: D-aminoacylase [Gammaproteobacteria bacterium]|nr:D-aminoacylase [Gammaproteobacteria bacterium]
MLAFSVLLGSACLAQNYDYLLTNGMIYDGGGDEPYRADIGIREQRIVRIGSLQSDTAKVKLDLSGLAVAPGFINMLSWATTTLLVDGRSQGDVRQGVTLEVFGEGSSMGPLNQSMRQQALARQSDYKFDIPWGSLGEYLEHLEARGVATNVASFVGATSIRVHELGYDNRAPSASELLRMQKLVEHAMQQGALGVASSLIYAPAFYAQTDELIALAEVAAKYGGMYISHMRSEGNRLLESIDELVSISKQANIRAEIYHFKVAGKLNWPKFDAAVAKIEQAIAQGLQITANMYTYTAGSTGLDAAMPPWVQEGGYKVWVERLRQRDTRQQVIEEMSTPTVAWENLLLAAGADKTLLVGFRNPDLRKYTGKTLAEVALLLNKSPQEAAIDLVIADGSRVQVVYFLMSEENVRKTLALPWVSFGSDAGSMSTAGVFLNTSTHPRAYGNFARVLGKYVRDERIISLPLAIHKLSKLPATNLRIRDRGEIKLGYYADLAIFDPAQITDNSTYAQPHEYATGMQHVFVNGQPVLLNGEHTGRLPGTVVRGPGWSGWKNSPPP